MGKEPGHDMPDAPPRSHQRHATVSAEEGEDEDEAQACVLYARPDGNAATVFRRLPKPPGKEVPGGQGRRIVENHQPDDKVDVGRELSSVCIEGCGNEVSDN